MFPIRAVPAGLPFLLFRLLREQVVAFFQSAGAFLFTEIAVGAVRFIFRIPWFLSFPSLHSGFLIPFFFHNKRCHALRAAYCKKRPWASWQSMNASFYFWYFSVHYCWHLPATMTNLPSFPNSERSQVESVSICVGAWSGSA